MSKTRHPPVRSMRAHRRFPNARVRIIQRNMHLMASLYLILYLYTPLGQDAIAVLVTRYTVIPLLIVTGLVMWQLPRISKFLRR